MKKKNQNKLKHKKDKKSPPRTPRGHQYLTQKRSYLAVLKKNSADVENTAWRAKVWQCYKATATGSDEM